MKIKSDRVTFVLVATGIVCTIIAAMGLLYRAFENMRKTDEFTESVVGSSGNMSQLGIKKITMDTESIPEATLTKLFNGQVSGDAISEFADMVDGFSLNVTVTTAFIDRIELYANENEENFRESEIVAYKLTMAPIALTLPPGWGGFPFPTESAKPTTTPETASVLIELCDVMSFDSCSACASSVLSDFELNEFDAYYDIVGEKISVRQYSLGVLRCGNSSTTTQNVKISFNTNEIRPTEIIIYGKELIEEEVREIKIHRSNEEGDQIRKDTLSRTTDKQFKTNAIRCYVAEGDFASLWASFEIAWSLVTHVDILTIGNKAESTEGIWVDVCSYGRECSPCGVLTMTPKGQWGGVYCLGGMIAGNEVQLKHSYQSLSFCEIKIFGKTFAKNTDGVIQMLDILSATEASIVPDTPNTNDSESTNVLFQYDLYYEANLETAQTYDNRWLTNAMSCYRTYKEIYFVINPSSVHYVKMLSPSYDSDWPWPLLGAQVNVCDSEGSSCKLCGYVTDRWAASWITVFCPKGGLHGSRVSVQKTYGNILIICEIELYGVLVSNH